MSTTTRNSLTYADYIAACVRHVANKLRGEDLAVAILQLLSGVLIYLVVAIALDHALALSWQVRTVLLLLAVGVATWHVVRHIAIPLVRRVNEWYVARTIDRVAPELADGMTTVLELERGGDDPRVFLARPIVEDRVVRILARTDVTERIGSDQLLRAWYLLAASVVLVCVGVLINSLFAQRSLMSSLARVLVPWADVAYPTRTRIVDVRPGDDPELSKAVAGSDVQVSAIVEGAVPEAVYLFWSVDGGQTWRRVQMKRPLTSLDPWLATLEAVEQSVVYYLEGGDCRTKTYRFTVLPVPVVQSFEIRYQPPEYTGQAPYTSDLPDIEALEGTRVTIIARLPEPVKRAELVLGPDKRRRLPMHRVPGKKDTVQASFDVTTDDVYRIWFTLESGATNPNPPVHQIKCLKDRPPVVRITEPGRDLVDPPVSMDGEVPVVVQASDDFGLRVVELVYDLPGRGGTHREVLFDGLKERRTEGEFRFELTAERFGLRPGEQLVYWVEVLDNKRPGAQKAQSQKYRVKFSAAERVEAVQEPQGEQERTEGDTTKGEPGSGEEQEQAAKGEENKGDEEQESVREQGGDRVEDPEEALEEIARFLEEMEHLSADGQDEQGGAEQAAQQRSHADAGADREPAAEEGQESGPANVGQSEGESGEQEESAKESSMQDKERGMDQKAGAEQEEAGRQGDTDTGAEGGPESSAEGQSGQEQTAGEKEGKAQPGGTEGGGERGAEDSTAPPEGGKTEPGTPTGRDLPELPEGVGLTGTRTGDKGEKGGTSGATEQGQPAADEGGVPDSGEGQGAGAATEKRQPGHGEGQPGEGSTQPGQAEEASKPPQGPGPAGRSSEPGHEQSASGEGTTGTGRAQPNGQKGQGGGKQGGRQPAQGKPGSGAGQASEQGRANQAGEGGAQQQSEAASGGQKGQGAGQQSGSGKPGEAEGAGGPSSKQGQPGAGSRGTPGGQGGQPSPTAQPGTGAPASGGSQGRTPGSVAGQQGGNAPQGAGAAPVAGTGERSRRAAPDERGAAGGAPGEGRGPQGAEAGGAEGEGDGRQGIRAPELVLKRLEDMLRNDQVDERLLKRLGWTRRDLERFVKYMKTQRVREQRKRSGRPQSRLLTSGPGTGSSGEDAALDVRAAKPPTEYKELVEAYTRSLSTAGKSEE